MCQPIIRFRLDERDDGDELQDYLQVKTGQRSVPNIFISTSESYIRYLKSSMSDYAPRTSLSSDGHHIGGELAVLRPRLFWVFITSSV
jgi:hypothetical protein